jgi:FAD/FMN-containing dehydrogenase
VRGRSDDRPEPDERVTVDPKARRARCGGGTTWADLDGATQAHGLAVPGGVISHTGVGGLSLGGGIGWLSRVAGLSCDNLVSARVVTADGRILTASAAENPDLHWALRGGGGNFGVVTEFEFALSEVGPLVQLALFFLEAERGAEGLKAIRDALELIPDEYGRQIVGLNAPPAPFVPEQFHFAPGYMLAIVGWGSPEEHAEVVARVRDDVRPTFELVTPIPYAELQKLLDASAPWGILGYEKALYVDELTDAAEDATAFGGSRSAKWLFNIAAIAPEPDLLATDRAWVREFWDALLPFASGSGSYVNFIAEVDDDRVRASYGATKYDRLSRIKTEYDPDNVFHLNANIKPR